jgi:hypothetical protein
MAAEQLPPEYIQSAMLGIQRKMAAQREWIARYGHVRPCLSVNFQGHKFVAAGRPRLSWQCV